jgi:hypothetical protein
VSEHGTEILSPGARRWPRAIRIGSIAILTMAMPLLASACASPSKQASAPTAQFVTLPPTTSTSPVSSQLAIASQSAAATLASAQAFAAAQESAAAAQASAESSQQAVDATAVPKAVVVQQPATPSPAHASSTTHASQQTLTPARAAATQVPPTPAPAIVPVTHELTGVLNVQARVDVSAGYPACGTGAFQTGQQVLVEDPTGAVIARGSLTNCTWQNVSQGFNLGPGGNFSYAAPNFTLDVTNVPDVPSFTIAIGSGQWIETSAALGSHWYVTLIA